LTAALPERRRNRPIARAAESATSGSSRSGPQCSRLAQVKDAALTEEELRLVMRTAAGHRFFSIIWLKRPPRCNGL